MRRPRRPRAGRRAGGPVPGALLAAAVAVIVSAAPGRGQTAPASTPCLKCHPQVSLEGTVHRGSSCESCHAGLIRRDGTPSHQAKKDLPDPTCATGSCHQEAAGARPGGTPAAYPDSVHGRASLERHEPDVARCWDCHGRHVIKAVSDPESLVNRQNIPMTCARCHEDMNVVVKYNIHAESPYREYSRSVHGRVLRAEAGSGFAAVCTDCHGVHNIQGVGASHLQARDPQTCGGCHKQAFDEYASSIHGREAAKGNPDAPLCVDCHGEHAMAAPGSPGSPTAKARIPDTCSTCHARPEIMKKYGIPVDRIATFIDSFHGIAVGMGGKEEATCVDCHGVHDIRPAADPRSKVFPDNLAKTCGQSGCHPKMTSKIAGTRIHRDYGRRSSGAPYYVRKIFLWAVLLAAVLSLVYFLPLLVRRVRGRAKT